MNKNNFKTNLISLLLYIALLATYGCSAPSIEGYTSDLDTIKRNEIVDELNLEIVSLSSLQNDCK